MKTNKIFQTIDTHTGGNPTRTVIGGVPPLSGATMADKMRHMQTEYDWIRRLLMYEPRGHDVMSGALLTAPCRPDADYGVIFIETGGYLPMCGHDTIGLCTALIETGTVASPEPITRLRLDTPAGLVEAEIEVAEGKAQQVSFLNIPAFYYGCAEVEVEGFGVVCCEIAYGGNFYAIVDAAQLGLALHREFASDLVDAAVRIRMALNEAIEVAHPLYDFIRGVTHVEFSAPPVHPQAHVRNTVVVPPGGIDRSPCGTGTSAKLALMHAKGEIGLREPFVHESIVGSLFRGEVVGLDRVGEYPAVTTRIAGSAWLMGMHTFFSNDQDERNDGFLLIAPAAHAH